MLQLSPFDYIIFIALCIIALSILLIALLFNGFIRSLLITIFIILFLSIPILNIVIIDRYINRIDLDISSARKLVYVDSFFISGKISNMGVRDIDKCTLYIYVDNLYPIQPPDYRAELNNINLRSKHSYDFDITIDKFSHDNYKRIGIICH